MATILLTGANGNIGLVLVEHLKKEHDLTLVDIDFSDVDELLLEGTTVKTADLTKPENWEGLLEGMEYVIHLAGDPSTTADFYESLLDLNYKMPHNLFYHASQEKAKIKRIIFASSIHAVSAYPPNVQVHIDSAVRPGNLYGVSKVYIEALAAHYAFTKNQEAVGIRIGDFKPDGKIDNDADPEGLAMFLSPKDACHLIDCALTAKLTDPYLLVNGLSNNTFLRLDIDHAKVTLGYHPQDDAFKMAGYFSEKD